jgi:hypothetical protein|tara:strand:+ start:865 stop:1050 length:186 start_codon:yes stop_codon:yes gene_type:complete
MNKMSISQLNSGQPKSLGSLNKTTMLPKPGGGVRANISVSDASETSFDIHLKSIQDKMVQE